MNVFIYSLERLDPFGKTDFLCADLIIKQPRPCNKVKSVNENIKSLTDERKNTNWRVNE
jgi:hypothetical protein